MILFEDIHWADNATLLALGRWPRRGPMSRCCGCLPRVPAPVDRPFGRPEGAGTGGCHVSAVDGHDTEAVADIVQDAVRANADVSLLTLAAKAHGNPFLVTELVGGLGEEGRLDVSGGRAAATGDRLPRRLSDTMQQRLDQLSDAASEVVQVAAVLPDRFSARLLAAMLERLPAALVSAVEEAVPRRPTHRRR